MALFKGSAYNLQDVLGNLSAPWVLLTFWSSALTARGKILRGVLLGAVFVELAFVGFYLGESIAFHMGIVPALLGGRIWSATGLVAGPLFGALGAFESRSSRGRMWFLMSSLFILEPFATATYFYLTARSANVGHLELAAYGIEVAVGILGCIFVARRFGLFKAAESTGA